MSKWISTTHAAARIGCGRKLVLRLLEEKALRGRRPRRNWQVCADSVEAFKKRIENNGGAIP